MPTLNRRNLIFLAFLVLYLLGDGDVGIGTGRAAFQFGHRNLPRYFKMHQNRSSLHPHGRSCINLNLRALVSHDANLLRFHQLISISGLLRRSFKCPNTHSRTSGAPAGLASCLFIRSMCCNPASNMLAVSFTENFACDPSRRFRFWVKKFVGENHRESHF